MINESKEDKICVYCGGKNPKTRDHVPPKGIFAPPRPILVTVPCCSDCHNATSFDDEYFRNMLAMRNDTHNHPDVQGILPKVYRALEKSEQKKFRSSLLRSIKDVSVKTSSGIYLGNASTYEVDKYRLGKVVERTVKGLYWHENKKMFPLGGAVKTYLVDDIGSMDENTFDWLVRVLNNAAEKEIGKGAFKYRMAQGEERALGFGC
jgi:hypothetical protein